MAAIVWADVVAFAPQLSTVASTVQTDILAHVNTALNVVTFGGESAPRLRLARIYLAAHVGTVTSGGGSAAAGPVTSESDGTISRSYASVSTAASDTESTSYGQMYAHLIRTSAARLPRVFD